MFFLSIQMIVVVFVRYIRSISRRKFLKHDLKFDDDENEKFARDQNEKNDDNDVRIEKKNRNE